jgi:O-antigen ligase/polysaccharide polymerase Wzy-like membrane protein
VHAIATLLAIEAVLVAVAYSFARGDWERTSLYLLGVTAPLEVYRTTVGGASVSLFRISVVIAVATVVGVRLRAPESRVASLRALPGGLSRIEAAYLFVALVLVASFVVHGEALFIGRRLLGTVVAGVAVIFACAELARRVGVRALATGLVAGAILPMLASLWQVLTPRIGGSGELPLISSLPLVDPLEAAREATTGLVAGTGSAVATRLHGTFVDPNHFGAYLAIIVLLAAVLAVENVLTRRRPAVVAFGAIAAGAAACLVATYSRSAWGAAVAASAVMLALAAPAVRARTTPRERRIGAAIALGLSVLVIAPLAPTLAARINPSSTLNAKSNARHKSDSQVGIDEFRRHPLYGLGVGGLGVVRDEQPRPSADSTYLTVAAELGAIGLFALLLAGGTALEALLRSYARVRTTPAALLPAGLAAAYLGFLGANAFYDQLWWRDFHFVVLGLIVAVTAGTAVELRRSS